MSNRVMPHESAASNASFHSRSGCPCQNAPSVEHPAPSTDTLIPVVPRLRCSMALIFPSAAPHGPAPSRLPVCFLPTHRPRRLGRGIWSLAPVTSRRQHNAQGSPPCVGGQVRQLSIAVLSGNPPDDNTAARVETTSLVLDEGIVTPARPARSGGPPRSGQDHRQTGREGFDHDHACLFSQAREEEHVRLLPHDGEDLITFEPA